MKIYKTTDEFDYTNLTLEQPKRVQGGVYYSPIKYNNDDLYINLPRCNAKNGITTYGKRSLCELLFANNNTSIPNIFNELERKIKDILFEKSSEWFQNKIDLEDIDYFFNSPLRTYKDNHYLLRCFVSKTQTNTNDIQIFDENEHKRHENDVFNKDVLSIIQIKAIRFTTNSFHLELQLKQLMILNNNVFSNCLIKKTTETDNILDTLEDKETSEDDIYTNIKSEEDLVNNQHKENNNLKEFNTEICTVSNEVKSAIDDIQANKQTDLEKIEEINIDNNSLMTETEDIAVKRIHKNADSLEEFTIKMPDIENEEPMQLKKPNEVYYEIYKEARKKAKLAKRAAMIAYLEARNIKNTYMLDNLNDSSDEEIDLEEIEQSGI